MLLKILLNNLFRKDNPTFNATELKTVMQLRGDIAFQNQIIDDMGVEWSDVDHYKSVWRVRKSAMMDDPKPITDHPLVNKKLRRKEDGNIYIVERVFKYWYAGNYYHMIARKEGTQSHVVIYDDINSKLELFYDLSRNYEVLT